MINEKRKEKNAFTPQQSLGDIQEYVNLPTIELLSSSYDVILIKLHLMTDFY